jgi:hypothetical protein
MMHWAYMPQVATDPTPFKGIESVPAAVAHLQSGQSIGKVGEHILKQCVDTNVFAIATLCESDCSQFSALGGLLSVAVR